MGVILDDITTFKNSLTGGSFEALAAATGESTALRWLGANTRVELLELWGGDSATKCQFSIRSPLLHDNTRGIRVSSMFNPTLTGADGSPQLFLPPYWKQPYEPTDTLIVEANGTAADRCVLTQLVKYDSPDIQGARLLDYSTVESRLRNLVGILVSPTGGATGDYGATVALNSSDDRLKANTDYALLGLTSDLPCCTIGIFGPDTSNFTIPMPGHWDEKFTSGFFYEMSRRWSQALIPVFNANNKAVTFIKAADVGGAVAPNVSLLFAELG